MFSRPRRGPVARGPRFTLFPGRRHCPPPMRPSRNVHVHIGGPPVPPPLPYHYSHSYHHGYAAPRHRSWYRPRYYYSHPRQTASCVFVLFFIFLILFASVLMDMLYYSPFIIVALIFAGVCFCAMNKKQQQQQLPSNVPQPLPQQNVHVQQQPVHVIPPPNYQAPYQAPTMTQPYYAQPGVPVYSNPNAPSAPYV
ncbi:hypothetical protein RCL1_002717 [Eukaryota sp. TZLM3-RCL]